MKDDDSKLFYEIENIKNDIKDFFKELMEGIEEEEE